MQVLGFDIGGTKCAVIVAEIDGNSIQILKKQRLPTRLDVPPQEMICRLIQTADAMINGLGVERIGISCGGPLDSACGVILGPPNLPGWKDIPIVQIMEEHFRIPAKLQNDANACAVAEWKFGAGRGCRSLVFLTFGTGLGAGLILEGKLYTGTNDNAGEIGHIRLADYGPVGYGKAGSFEGFCSGGGLAQLGYMKALERVQCGEYPAYFRPGMTAADIPAQCIAEAAQAGDVTAQAVYHLCGEQLGRGLSILIDLLNPEKIVIGSVFARAERWLRAGMEKTIRREALSAAVDCCSVVSAELGEQLGDYAAVATALL